MLITELSNSSKRDKANDRENPLKRERKNGQTRGKVKESYGKMKGCRNESYREAEEERERTKTRDERDENKKGKIRGTKLGMRERTGNRRSKRRRNRQSARIKKKQTNGKNKQT